VHLPGDRGNFGDAALVNTSARVQPGSALRLGTPRNFTHSETGEEIVAFPVQANSIGGSPATIRLYNMSIRGLFLPGANYDVVVTINSVNSNDFHVVSTPGSRNFTANSVAGERGIFPAPGYSVQVLNFTGQQHPPTQPQPPIVQPPAPPVLDTVFSVPAGATFEDGTAVSIVRNGVQLFSLREFVGGLNAAFNTQGVEDTGSWPTFSVSAPNPSGQAVTLTATVDQAGAIVNVGGMFLQLPMPAPVFYNGRVYLPVSAFTSIFGFNVVPVAGGGFNIVG
jgi:hypothetical protein